MVAANDGTGGGAISAFKAAGVTPPPVSGNDAELAAAQRIVTGDQYNTISKPIKIVAGAAAEVAYAFAQGKPPEGEDDALRYAVPAVRALGRHQGEPEGEADRQR